MSEDVFDASTFSKNRERFLSVEMTAQFFDGVVEQARTKRLCACSMKRCRRVGNGRWPRMPATIPELFVDELRDRYVTGAWPRRASKA